MDVFIIIICVYFTPSATLLSSNTSYFLAYLESYVRLKVHIGTVALEGQK